MKRVNILQLGIYKLRLILLRGNLIALLLTKDLPNSLALADGVVNKVEGWSIQYLYNWVN